MIVADAEAWDRRLKSCRLKPKPTRMAALCLAERHIVAAVASQILLDHDWKDDSRFMSYQNDAGVSEVEPGRLVGNSVPDKAGLAT